LRPRQVEAVPPGTVERVKNVSNNRAAPAENLPGAFSSLRNEEGLGIFPLGNVLRARSFVYYRDDL